VRVDERIVLFDTNHGEETNVRRPMFWKASSLRQFASDSSGSHAGPAYDRVGLTYSWSRFSLVVVEMGLGSVKNWVQHSAESGGFLGC